MNPEARRGVATGLAGLFLVCLLTSLAGWVRGSASGDFRAQAGIADAVMWEAAVATFAALMILAAVAATPPGKRWSTRRVPAALEASCAPLPAVDGVHWMLRSAGTERRMRQAAIITCVALLFSGLVLWRTYDLVKRRAGSHPKPAVVRFLADFRKGAMGEGLIMTTLLLQVAIELRSRRVRLGTDGRQVFAELPNGELLTVSGERLVYDRRSIAFENCLVRINTPKGRSLYEGKEVETYLAPLLGSARRVGSFGMLWYRLVHRERTLVATYLCYSVCAVMLMITGAWRPLGTWLLKGLHSG